MIKTNENPSVKKYFKDENLAWQDVYKAKEKYDVAYINPKLYEEIFNEKYNWKTASENISECFSLTLNKEKSTLELVGQGFADRQADPTGIALNGNIGSGRAYFFGEYFNIKGDKTTLAVSTNPIYNNGKFALSAAIKETMISNILAEDFVIPSFQTLAILLTKENCNFIDEYIDENDVLQQQVFNLPCVLEIRINKDKELYRISNSYINKDNYSKKDIESMYKKLAIVEANKFADRFLHGSWSAGNITLDANMIDFDTSSFVKGRHPQYSNINKYKSNYFGNELIGQKLMMSSFLDSLNMSELKEKLENLMDKTYEENLKIRFCDLIGLTYEKHYKKYQEYIDGLFETFNKLSRKFLPNYYATNVYSRETDITYLFDFSKFFQKYLLEKKNSWLGLKFLVNQTEEIIYEKTGIIKETLEEFFLEDLVPMEEVDKFFNDILDFIMEYDELFKEVKKEYNLKDVIYKQYIINANRDYIYANKNICGKLSWLYENKKIDLKTLNIILNALIKTNIRNSKKEENLLGLRLYQECLTYFVLSKNYYKLVIESYSNTKINSIKVIINGKEMSCLSFNENDNILISEKIEFEELPNILNYNVTLEINDEECKVLD